MLTFPLNRNAQVIRQCFREKHSAPNRLVSLLPFVYVIKKKKKNEMKQFFHCEIIDENEEEAKIEKAEEGDERKKINNLMKVNKFNFPR